MRRPTIFGAVLAAAMIFASGCGGLSPQTRLRFEEALAASEAGEWHRSSVLWSELLRDEPDMSAAHVHLAEAFLGLERHEEALEEVEKAISCGELEGDQLAHAYVLRGLAWSRIGERTLDDSSFRRREGSPDAIRSSRDAFLAASVAFDKALEIDAKLHDALLHRAYALYRQENATKALDLLRRCEKSGSRDWRLGFFRALALEALHGPNLQSYELAVSVADAADGNEVCALVRYLVDGHARMPDALAGRVPAIARAFREEHGDCDPAIESFLAEIEKKEAIERRAEAIGRLTRDARRLANDGDLAAAMGLIREHERAHGTDAALTALANELNDRWIRFLDLRVQSALQLADEPALEKAIDEYTVMGRLTGRLEDRIAAQQKVNELRLTLRHLASTTRLREIAQILEDGDPRRALEMLKELDPAGIASSERDRWRWLVGLARFRTEDWTGALEAFESMEDRSRDDLAIFQGLACARAGKRSEAVRLLSTVPPQEGYDDVNRLLAEHFVTRGDDARAALHLATIGTPTPEDVSLRVSVLKRLGTSRHERGDWLGAIEALTTARRLLDESRHGTDPDLYLLLGSAHLRLDDLAAAKRVYNALVNSDLSRDERSRCREVYVDLARIHLREKREDLAYLSLREYLRLSGSVPAELEAEWGRLAAAFADYMPLDRVRYWNYTSTLQDYNYTITVNDKVEGRYRIERREAGRSLDETWRRDGKYVVQHTGRDGSVEFRL
ncbi:MAG TPA: tetratricopeptide repeat protein, partial [Planctomycetota bacterium]|nr:tetratricopeptide repeat protein [Planctomycetota bacterium]